MLLKSSDEPDDVADKAQDHEAAAKPPQLAGCEEETSEVHSTEPNDDLPSQGDAVDAQLISIASELDRETTTIVQNGDIPTTAPLQDTEIDGPLPIWSQDQNAEEQDLVPDVRPLEGRTLYAKCRWSSHK